MNRADTERFEEVFYALCNMYGKDPTAFLFKAFFETLSDLTIEQVEEAVIGYMAQPEAASAFMPTPGTLRKLAIGSLEDEAMSEWRRVINAVRAYGGYRSVAFDNPMVHAVIKDLGGWSAICRTETSELPFLEQRFCKLYQRAKNTPIQNLEYPSHLAGIVETTNGQYNEAGSPIVMIGDEETVKSVMKEATNSGKPDPLATTVKQISAIQEKIDYDGRTIGGTYAESNE